jgi:hypothetical protein
LQHQPLSLASLIFLLGGSFLVTRFFFSRRWHLSWTRLSIIFSGLIVIFTVIRIEYGAGFGLLNQGWFVYAANVLLNVFIQVHPMIIALVAGTLLWWRGISLGRSFLYFENIYPSFLIGFGALAGATVFLALGAQHRTDFRLTGLLSHRLANAIQPLLGQMLLTRPAATADSTSPSSSPMEPSAATTTNWPRGRCSRSSSTRGRPAP